MVNGKGTSKPYISFVGNSSVDVTGSMHLVRFKKYVTLLDCGLVQLNDPMTSYKANREQLKKIKPREIDYIIVSHAHIDHSGMICALFAKGCQAHIYIPMGCKGLLKLLWADSLKIMQSDYLKLERKHGIKAPPLYSEDDINRALDRCIEVDYYSEYQINPDMTFVYHPAGHIVCSAQVELILHDNNIVKKIGYTGDIGGGTISRPYTRPRKALPFVDILIGENTYNASTRPNKASDRAKDIEKLYSITETSNKILIPSFSLQRTQEMLRLLWELGIEVPIYLDSPLSQKICKIWDNATFQQEILTMPNLKQINSWEDSQALQNSDEHCIILSASGFLNGGRVVAHLKTVLPDRHNHIVFIGYAGENNLASQIKSNQKEVVIDGEVVKNLANITELRSFSSHANYDELIDYYTNQTRFNKLCLVHGNYNDKVEFSKVLQNKLYNQGKSAKVVCVNEGTKIYL